MGTAKPGACRFVIVSRRPTLLWPVHAGTVCSRDGSPDLSPFATRDPQLINFLV